MGKKVTNHGEQRGWLDSFAKVLADHPTWSGSWESNDGPDVPVELVIGEIVEGPFPAAVNRKTVTLAWCWGVMLIVVQHNVRELAEVADLIDWVFATAGEIKLPCPIWVDLH